MKARTRLLAACTLALFAALPLGAQSVASGDSEEMVPGSGLELYSNVRGASVYLNGEFIGKTPLYAYDVKPGLYSLRVEKEGYEQYRRSIYIPAGILVRLQVVLEPLGGLLSVYPVDPGLKLSIDGAPVFFPGGTIRLHSGVHRVDAKLFGFEPFTATLSISEGEVARLELVFVPCEPALTGMKVYKGVINPKGRDSYRSASFSLAATGPLAVKLEVLDAAGRKVAGRDLGELADFETIFYFDGKDDSGAPLPDGAYTLAVSDASGKYRFQGTVKVDSKLTVSPMGMDRGLLDLARAGTPFLLPRGGLVLDAGVALSGAALPPDAGIGLAFAPTDSSEFGIRYQGSGVGGAEYLWDLWVGGKVAILDLSLLKASFYGSFLAFTNGDSMGLSVVLPEGRAGLALGFGSDAVGLSASAEIAFGVLDAGAGIRFSGGAGAWLSLDGFKIAVSGSLSANASGFAILWPIKASVELAFPQGILSWRIRGDIDMGPSTSFVPSFAGLSAGASLVF